MHMQLESVSINDVLRKYLPEINKISLSIWYKVRDETVFQKKCIENLNEAVKRYSPQLGHFDSLAKSAIWRAKVSMVKRRQVPWEHFESVDETRREGERLELADDLAVVDDEMLVNERIASLAGDDSKREFILKAWSEGYFNESELASILADRFGGNARSHCKFIQRFRTECREKLQQTA